LGVKAKRTPHKCEADTEDPQRASCIVWRLDLHGRYPALLVLVLEDIKQCRPFVIVCFDAPAIMSVQYREANKQTASLQSASSSLSPNPSRLVD